MEVDPYFESYQDLLIHELMLRDAPRNRAYKRAIEQNAARFKDMTVLDVGSGTGLLSIFAAKAGAKKVYAVEASNVAELSKEVVKENGFENIVEVVHSKIEDFLLPDGAEKVDIIISEFMGFYLLHEGMLDSVLLARDRFLKPGGLMFPDRATIYCSPCSLPELFDNWENIDGVKMTRFAEHLRRQKSTKPEVMDVPWESLLGDDAESFNDNVVAFLDLNDITAPDLDRIDFTDVIVARKAGKFQGLCIWFDVMFPTPELNEDDDEMLEFIKLSTHPRFEKTHWKQTVIPLGEASYEALEPQTPIALKLILQRNPQNSRHYDLMLEMLDPEGEDVKHPVPCDCFLTKCILTKAVLKNYEPFPENPENE